MEPKPLINPVNAQTFLVVAFVLAMLALVLGLFHSVKISTATALANDWIGQYTDNAAMLNNDMRQLDARVKQLEQQLADMKAASADTPAADSAAAIEEAP